MHTIQACRILQEQHCEFDRHLTELCRPILCNGGAMASYNPSYRPSSANVGSYDETEASLTCWSSVCMLNQQQQQH